MGDPYPELYLDPPYRPPQQRGVDNAPQQRLPPIQHTHGQFPAVQQRPFNIATWPHAAQQIVRGHQPAGRPPVANPNAFLARAGQGGFVETHNDTHGMAGLPQLTERGFAGAMPGGLVNNAHPAGPGLVGDHRQVAGIDIQYPGVPRGHPAAIATPRRPTPHQDSLSTTTTAPLTPSTQPNQPPSSTQKKRRAPSGKGSKSGVGNRRKGGDSDEEIGKLDVAQMNVAGIKTAAKLDEDAEKSGRGLTDLDKVMAVQYITSSDVWTELRLHQHTIFVHIATVILKNRVTAVQVRNYWHNQAWEKYKAVRKLQEHTGGGDGDDEGVDDAADGGKKKRGMKDGFSRDVLLDFENSEIFRLIDAVAHDDESVTRDREYNSAVPVSDEEESPKMKTNARKRKRSGSNDENDALDRAMNRALAGIEAKNKRQEAADKIQLELAMKRDRREQEEHEARLADARRKARDERWKQAMDMLGHANLLIKQKGERMIIELTAEEEREAEAEERAAA